MRALTALIVLAAMAGHRAASAAELCTAIAEARSGRIILQQGDCAQRATPASTFKIPLSLMGYDSGYLVDEHRPSLPFVEGYADWIEAWKTTVDPTYWMTYSVVWYSQQLTQKLGEQRFARYVQRFHYGNANVSGDPGKHNGLQRAWLSSSLRISPLEQIAFLRKVVNRRLSLAARAYDMTNRITQLDDLPGGWQVHGKTGTGPLLRPDGTKDPEKAYGWFVGWVVRADRSYVFARLSVLEQPLADRAGPHVRDGLLSVLPALLESRNAKP